MGGVGVQVRIEKRRKDNNGTKSERLKYAKKKKCEIHDSRRDFLVEF